MALPSLPAAPWHARDAHDWILHVDLDQFIAAVEVLRHPELRGRPVVVGTSGDPTRRRAVVATASYEARRFGVRAGMPLRAAARRCPDATFLASDAAAYEAASARVMATLRALPVVVEVYGWDEAFLGARTEHPEKLAADVRAQVLGATGLSCSIGIGDTKTAAKLATGFAKPAGIFRLTGANWRAVMGERPVGALWGIGPRTAAKLDAMGLATVSRLAGAEPDMLVERFGPSTGPWLRRIARGGGDRTVDPRPRVPRSRSREQTFPEDLTSRTQIVQAVERLARDLAQEASRAHRPVNRIWVKVRFAPYFTAMHSMKLPWPSQEAADIAGGAIALLDRFDLDRPVRLLGVRVEFHSAGRKG